MNKQSILWMYCLLAVMAFGFTACSDDDENVGSREMLIGEWEGVSYYWEEWTDGELDGSGTEDFTDGTHRVTETYLEDGTYKFREQFSYGYDKEVTGSWSYKGNKLTYSDSGEEPETFTVTKLTDTELEYELRYSEKEDGEKWESYEKYVFRRK